MSFDRPETYSASVLPHQDIPDLNSDTLKAFKRFILDFRVGNDFIYRSQLRDNIRSQLFLLHVKSEHLIAFHEELYQRWIENPTEMIPLFEKAITEIAQMNLYLANTSTTVMPQCQLIMNSNENRLTIRELDSDHISKIVKISGIVISTSMLSSKAQSLTLMCRSCRHIYHMNSPSTFGMPQFPKQCLAPPNPDGEKPDCPPNPYLIVHEKSNFVDMQTLKLQESSDLVPVGEMPRHILLSVDRYLCNRVVPGTRCDIVGIYSIYQSKMRSTGAANAAAIRNPYLKVIGIQAEREGLNSNDQHFGSAFTEEEEEQFIELSRTPDLYEKFAKSIAPSIYGNEDIKKSITCLLFSGSRKLLPDGMRLRGDINVLMLGDPGTAKSQLLKFTEKVSPIAIYTSGKGSSAAGLTASVQRDPMTRDFYLEGGAMVLADGGIVCIDEFDKMRDEDRVAIHEAMEQQTISIAKAGITTVLNSRTSVLAAANPVFGRYDETRAPGENIDFQTTVLSRFDMIFIVKDEQSTAKDMRIAQHVMNVHTGETGDQEDEEGDIPLEFMKKYIRYAKSTCAPRLSSEASEMLSSEFVSIRRDVKQRDANSTERSSIPITIRQLEAIIRITESLAKITLSPVATVEHVQEAMRLFNASTLSAIHGPGGSVDEPELVRQTNKIEAEIKRRLPMGWSTSFANLRRQFVERGEYSLEALERALGILERREVIRWRSGRGSVFRCGV
ncbi:MCM DNA helicase complex subunit [Martiniozyma asiatica (nom. inval.)]|nr:MCM DNA helicase complex subunit [Martiniozyma asiatica]